MEFLLSSITICFIGIVWIYERKISHAHDELIKESERVAELDYRVEELNIQLDNLNLDISLSVEKHIGNFEAEIETILENY